MAQKEIITVDHPSLVKLAGIEEGATADQTATEIQAALKLATDAFLASAPISDYPFGMSVYWATGSSGFVGVGHVLTFRTETNWGTQKFVSSSESREWIRVHAGIAGGWTAWTEMTDHNQLRNLTTGDPHTQYLNESRGDGRYAAIKHKYHKFAVNEYYYDSYNQNEYLRLFTENAAYSSVRYQPVYSAEYWDGTAWVGWTEGVTGITNLLDGRESTGLSVDHAHRQFRFIVGKKAWSLVALLMLQTQWSPISYPSMTLTFETSSTQAGTYTVRDTATFDSTTGGGNWGIHLKVSDKLHLGDAWMRVTVEIDDWVDSGASTTVPLRRLEVLSNYAGNQLLPYTQGHDQEMYIKGNRMWHAGNDGPGSGLDADTVDGQEASAFSTTGHLHDDRYYTETEVDTALGGKSDTGHGHADATPTVSGFHSAADKGKLDGIETGATADQTDAEILDAVKRVDGAASGLDADLLDGVDSAGFTPSSHVGSGGTAHANATTTVAGFLASADKARHDQLARGSEPMILAKNTSQSIAHATWTEVQWQVIEYDNSNGRAGLAGNRYNVNRNGMYEVWAGVAYTGLPSTSSRFIGAVYVNGALRRYVYEAYSGTTITPSGSAVVDCVSGDYIQVFTYHNCGSTQTTTAGSTTTYFGCQYAGG